MVKEYSNKIYNSHVTYKIILAYQTIIIFGSFIGKSQGWFYQHMQMQTIISSTYSHEEIAGSFKMQMRFNDFF